MKRWSDLTEEERHRLTVKVVVVIIYVLILIFGGGVMSDIFRAFGWIPAAGW